MQKTNLVNSSRNFFTQKTNSHAIIKFKHDINKNKYYVNIRRNNFFERK